MPPSRKEVIQQMLHALESPHKDLTEWEENFLESIAKQFDRSGSLSDKQFEILDRIYAEKTP
jgi:hypothetical protein